MKMNPSIKHGPKSSSQEMPHLNAKIAIQICTYLTNENQAILLVSLTFGGAPGLYGWRVISKVICDFSMAILQGNK
jgi:hypothetical protein